MVITTGPAQETKATNTNQAGHTQIPRPQTYLLLSHEIPGVENSHHPPLILPRVLVLPAARTQDLAGLPESAPQDPRVLRSQQRSLAGRTERSTEERCPSAVLLLQGRSLPRGPGSQQLLCCGEGWNEALCTKLTEHLISIPHTCHSHFSLQWLQTQGSREKHISHRLGRWSPSWEKALSKSKYKKGWGNYFTVTLLISFQLCCSKRKITFRV